MINLKSWSFQHNALAIYIGGSFVTNKICPNDIDVIVLFQKKEHLPKSSERLFCSGITMDIQLLSLDEKEILDAYLDVFSHDYLGNKKGLVKIVVNHSPDCLPDLPADRTRLYDSVLTSYVGHYFARLDDVKGVVIPIHGIRTHADWLPQLTLQASLDGWAVAPFVYGYKDITILRNQKEKDAVQEAFRQWLSTIRRSYSGPISIIAHSFGTYIIGRYLSEAGDISATFESIILCGSILNTAYDWTPLFNNNKVGRVLNTISEKDEFVKFLPDNGIAVLAKDSFYGQAGVAGFSCQHENLQQIASKLLKHNNLFEDDVIFGQWLPFLNLNRDFFHRKAGMAGGSRKL